VGEAAGRPGGLWARDDLWLLGSAQIGLDLALIFYRHWIAMTVHGLAHGQPHPALADAIFLDIVAVHAVETHAHAPLQQLGVVIRALGIGGKPVGQIYG